MQKKINLIIGVVALVLLVSAGLWGLRSINTSDKKQSQQYASSAMKVGTAKAKEECRKEGLSSTVCDSITAVSDEAECGGKVCWNVYAQSSGPEYGASVTVSRIGDKHTVSDYLRNTGKTQ